MSSFFIYLLLVVLIVFLISFLLYFNSIVGLKNFFLYFKAYRGRKKGLILVRIYQKTGSAFYFLGKKKGQNVVFINDTDKNEVSYILTPKSIYRNELNLNCIDYFERDVDARSWSSNTTHTLSPQAFSNIVSNLVKSEVSSSFFEDFIKKYGKLLGIGFLIFVGILVFIIMQQNDHIVTLSTKLASQSIPVITNSTIVS